MTELTFQDLVDFVDGNRGSIAPETQVYMQPVLLFGVARALELVDGEVGGSPVVVVS